MSTSEVAASSGRAAEQVEIPGVEMQNSPAMSVFAGHLYMAHCAGNGDQLMYATFDGSAWSASTPIVGRSSSATPALAVYRGKLYLVRKGRTGDNRIWYASFDGATWSADQIVPGISTSGGPALAVFKGKLYLACKGAGAGNTIWYAAFDGAKWSAGQTVPGARTAAKPALATYSERLYLAFASEDSNGTVRYQTYDGTSWSVRQGIPGAGTSVEPSLVTFDRKLLLAHQDQRTGLLHFAAKGDGEWEPAGASNNAFIGMTGSAGLAVFRNRLYCSANLGKAMGYFSRSAESQQNITGYVKSYTFGSVDDPLAIGVEVTDTSGNTSSGSILGQTETSSTGFTVILALALEIGYSVTLLGSSTDVGVFNGVQLFVPTLPG